MVKLLPPVRSHQATLFCSLHTLVMMKWILLFKLILSHFRKKFTPLSFRRTDLPAAVTTTQYNLTSQSKPGTPGWIRSRACSGQLFEQMKFFLPHSFSNSECLPRHKLKELITICGGSCYDKPWEMAGAQNALTIFSPKSCEWDAAQRYEASMDGIPVVVADWVLDSIAEFRLMPLD
ncbi:hypothetical protein OESDEN_24863, partial [Oesophagostomum dentatum]